MKKIFVNTPYSSDANSFWRCMGPLSYLVKNSDEYTLYCPPLGAQFQWDGIAQYDVIFMHRPCRPDDIKLIQMARSLNIPVWSDYDDWLFHVPDWNPHESVYNDFQRQQIMATAIACSDVVTVSTNCLQAEFSKINKNVILLPNAYRDDLFSYRDQNPPERKNIFYWRGTNTHDGDMNSVVDAFRSLKQPTHFIGMPSSFVVSQMNKELVVKTRVVDNIKYWRYIYELAGKVMVFPLDGHYFNQCKSNIAWIEAMHAGSIIVAPDLPEWRHPGVFTYACNDSETFLQACESAMSFTEDQIKEYNHDGYIYMKSKYGIKNVNQIRLAILHSLFSPSFERNQRDPMNPVTGAWALNVLKNDKV